jgi:hypothetical protein
VRRDCVIKSRKSKEREAATQMRKRGEKILKPRIGV